MKVLKIVFLIFAGALALFVLIGLFLPRQWSAESSAQTRATPAQVMPLVRDFREWSKWTTTMPDFKYEFSPEQGVPGSWMSWKGPGSRAKFILTHVADNGIKYDAQMESDSVNASGEIFADGSQIIWKDSGTLPAIIGGYFRGVMNKALTEHMATGLAQLKSLAEATPVAAPPPPVDADAGGAYDAGVATDLDAGTSDADAGTR